MRLKFLSRIHYKPFFLESTLQFLIFFPIFYFLIKLFDLKSHWQRVLKSSNPMGSSSSFFNCQIFNYSKFFIFDIIIFINQFRLSIVKTLFKKFFKFYLKLLSNIFTITDCLFEKLCLI